MNKLITRRDERGTADYGWLKPNYYFSFGGYRDDKKIHFGALRVLNDDFIGGGGRFETHPHDNMEIVTIPFTGKLHHKDSTGGEGIIAAGDVQIMSAGTGVMHSESNASEMEPVTLFQVWVFPKIKNIKPRYDQKTFDKDGRINKWQVVVSPNEEDEALWINQDAKFLLTDLTPGKQISYETTFPGSGFYIVVLEGECIIDGETFLNRDAVGISDVQEINITSGNGCSLLLIEIPMKF